ncbi:MAG: ATP-binding protein [Candidatus Eisenbacteria bacterium]
MNAPPLWRRLTFEKKLLVAFLALALLPTIVLVATQKDRIERLIDFWENPGVERALRESLDFATAAVSAEGERTKEALEEALARVAEEDLSSLSSEEIERAARRSAGGLDLLNLALGDRPDGQGAERIASIRKRGVPETVRLPGIFAEGTDPRLAVAHGSVLLDDGRYLAGTGGVLLPEEYGTRLAAIRDGVRFYQRLGVYERYAKARVGAQIGIILIAAGLLAFVVARFLSRSLSRPIQSLVAGTRRVREGDLTVRVEPPGPDEIGALVNAFNEMIRDLHASRERLVRAERVATWAEAARRIAHEIKNPLTPITLSLHRLKKRTEKLPEKERRAFEELLEPILEETGNLVSLADQFSQFSRLPAPASAPVDLRDLFEKVTALYREGTGLRVRIDVREDTPAARGDRELLWRAFSNLVKNAAEAMAEGGELLLSAIPAGEGVEIRVADNGPGIDPKTRDRIFSPYFTTKASGSGLGLALVERIIHDHGGTITVEANEPRGTVFRILLPAAP